MSKLTLGFISGMNERVAPLFDGRVSVEVEFYPPLCGMGIDATLGFKDAKLPPVKKISNALTQQVAARWKEYGLS